MRDLDPTLFAEADRREVDPPAWLVGARTPGMVGSGPRSRRSSEVDQSRGSSPSHERV